MRKTHSLICAALIMAAQPSFAQSSDGRELAKLAFLSGDADGDGQMSLSEVLVFGDDIFVSMDSDDNNNVSISEYLEWGFGFSNVAEDTSKMQGYETAQKIVFDLLDRDDDQMVSANENLFGAVSSMGYADLDSDGFMSEQEFLRGFITNIAFRAALRPE